MRCVIYMSSKEQSNKILKIIIAERRRNFSGVLLRSRLCKLAPGENSGEATMYDDDDE